MRSDLLSIGVVLFAFAMLGCRTPAPAPSTATLPKVAAGLGVHDSSSRAVPADIVKSSETGQLDAIASAWVAPDSAGRSDLILDMDESVGDLDASTAEAKDTPKDGDSTSAPADGDALFDGAPVPDQVPTGDVSSDLQQNPPCPPFNGAGNVSKVLCTEGECCISGMTAGPCGWVHCCDDPSFYSPWAWKGPPCPEVEQPTEPVPPWPWFIPAGKCPALALYDETKPLPSCAPKCWCPTEN